MVNTTLLCEVIKKSGLKRYYIAEKLNLTTYGLQKKIENNTQFKADEIKEFCNILGIDSLEEREKIFFADNVDEVPTSKKEEQNAE